MVDSGAGGSLNTSFLTVNMPPVHSESLKRSKQFVGAAIKKHAKTSCVDSIQEGKKNILLIGGIIVLQYRRQV